MWITAEFLCKNILKKFYPRKAGTMKLKPCGSWKCQIRFPSCGVNIFQNLGTWLHSYCMSVLQNGSFSRTSRQRCISNPVQNIMWKNRMWTERKPVYLRSKAQGSWLRPLVSHLCLPCLVPYLSSLFWRRYFIQRRKTNDFLPFYLTAMAPNAANINNVYRVQLLA